MSCEDVEPMGGQISARERRSPMRVKELIAELRKLPEDAEVLENDPEYGYSRVRAVRLGTVAADAGFWWHGEMQPLRDGAVYVELVSWLPSA